MMAVPRMFWPWCGVAVETNWTTAAVANFALPDLCHGNSYSQLKIPDCSPENTVWSHNADQGDSNVTEN